ncbi:MAG: hypothetical protein U0W24_05760 [Bacteroidales bacterium]
MNPINTIRKSKKKIWQKWSVAFRILPTILVIIILKLLTHYFKLELMELNALFTSLVAGTIFLIGFLISGVLSDYKESEKIPTELTATLKTIFDDTQAIWKMKKSDTANEFIEFQKNFIHDLFSWFYKKEKTKAILDKINQMTDYFVKFDNEGLQVNYIIKLKNEQHNLRKILMRIDTIRDTEFTKSAYAIVEAMGFFIAIGLIIMKIEPFYASLFFTILVVFLIFYMFFLIKDLDNPYDYSEKGESGTEISLKPLHDFKEDINKFQISVN